MEDEKNNNVSVGVRVRPRNQKEIEAEMPLYQRVKLWSRIPGSNR